MSVGIRVLLVLALLTGIVWMGQGVGLIKGSFMTGDPLWAVIGSIMSAGAAIGIWLSLRPREG